ncbi:MAG TPA: LamG-like jellyroll fold domain-containing protein, partial [Pirellulaceae bacterium]|nr:LamG-like jellyroll fold domain-containing protein [Pirellulaceae bacterium]
ADVPSKEPSPVPQANLDQKNPQPPSTPPEVAPPGPIESIPLVLPPAVPGPAVEIEGKARVENSVAPVTGNTGKASKKKGAKAAADRQWLTPARKAAPTAAQLAKAHEQIAALERPPPKTDQERGTLAANLLAKGKDQQLPDADRYAALEKACELAASAGDAKLLAQAVGALTQAFELDPRPLEGNWLVQAAENVGTAPQVDALLVALQPAIAFAVSEGDFEEALRLADAALAVCQKPQGQQHREWAIWGRQDIARQHAARKTMNDALATLQPHDPAAHLAAARWLILERNDWPRALPHLAQASDPQLKQAAALDLANPATSEAQLAAADAWHAAGKGPPGEAFCLARALHWYELARRGSLPKPESVKAERRIAELRSSRAVAALQLRLKSAVGIGSLSDRLSPAVRRHCVAAFTFEASDLFSANGETTLIDRSGRRHHGRVYGTSPSFGKVGASYLFDGPEDVVECSDAPSLNPTSGLTLCAWVRPQQVSQGTVDYIISKDDWKVGTPRGFVLRLSYRGRPNMTLGSGGWWGPTVREAIKLNEWTHLAGVYDGRQIVVLVNGEEVGQGACAGQPTPSPFDLRIGKGTYDKNRRFQGEIDEVAIFDMALTAADIKTIYELGTKGQSLAN